MTRRLLLHIGSHKTGTTSTQIALRQGQRDKTLGGWSYLHARPRVDFNPLVRCVGMGPEMHPMLRWPFFDRRMENANARGHGDCILSTEMLFWLNDPAQIARLHARLRDHFDEIRVIAYLRRQDRLALSHRKQVVMGRAAYQFYGAQLQALPVYRPHMQRYFDYAAKLAKWEEVFGRDAVTVRRFQREDLVGGDAVLDFYAWAGLPPPPARPRENAAWSRSQLLAGLWLRQRGFPRESFVPAVEALPADGPLLPARAEAEAFLEPFAASNQALAARYDPEGPAGFFEAEMSGYPAKANGGHTAPGGLAADPVVTATRLADLARQAEVMCQAQDLPRDPRHPADDRI